MRSHFKKFVLYFLILCILGQSIHVEASPFPSTARQTETVVTPEAYATNLAPGESETFQISISALANPIQRIDVLFLFDVTSSMSGVLEQAKTNGKAIMNTLRRKVADSAFGVASFSDYPGSFSYAGYVGIYGGPSDYPWLLNQDISADTSAVDASITSLSLHDGQDGPEDYSRAFFETIHSVNWRTGAKHVVVLFGDAPAHDTNFYETNYGVDPGPDSQAGTDDDLTFVDTVNLLKTQGIIVLPINSDQYGNSDVAKGFDYIASETGGQVYTLGDSALLADTVSSGLQKTTSTIRELKLTPDERFDSWVKISPERVTNISGALSETFDVTLTVPAGEAPKSVFFDILANADGSILGKTTVFIEIGIVPLDGTKILEEKKTLIEELKHLDLNYTFFDIELNFDGLMGYPAEDDVETWVNGLQARDLSPAELDALYRLTRQEDGMNRAWRAVSKNVHITVAQIAHIIGLVVTSIGAWQIAKKLLTKTITGNLVRYLENFILSKIVGMVNVLINWVISGIEDKSVREIFGSVFSRVCELFQARLENELKTANFSKSFAGDAAKNVVAELLVQPFELGVDKIYVNDTNGEISRALGLAQASSARSIPLSTVEEQAPSVKASIEVLIGPIENRTAINEQIYSNNKIQQEGLLYLTNGFAALSGILALTGFGAVVSTVTYLVSLCIKAFDGVMSTTIAVEAGKTASEAWNAGKKITDASFAAYTYDPFKRTYELNYSSVPVSLKTDLRLGDPVSEIMTVSDRNEIAMSSSTSVTTAMQLNEVHQGVADFNRLLQQLNDAVASGDQEAVETIAQELMTADEELTFSFATAETPIYNAAAKLLLEEDSAFNLAYSDVGKAAVHFSGEGAILYMYILAWLNEPENNDIKNSLLNQISTVKQTSVVYEQVIADARPMVEAYVQEPTVLVSNYSFPDEMTTGQQATLTLQIQNIAPNTANDVVAKLSSNEADNINSAENQVGALGSNETREIQFTFIPRSETGFLDVFIDSSNGSATYKLIPYSASVGSGGSGFGIMFILLLVAGGGIAVYVLGQRRTKNRSKTPGRVTSAQLLCISGDLAGRTFPLKDKLLVGRGSGSTLKLKDRTASRQHATFRFASGQWFIQDMNSQTGTFVNEARIQATSLKSGDRIRIGSSVFEFRTTR